ncbi:MAG: AAA family ATPase [Phycisphaerales bacterium]|nr:AAA family ATPase [Phycisphaerales bacterium]
MPRDYSPFTPGHPLPPSLFAGRQREVEALLGDCRRAQHSGRVERSYIEGERGIGKSSLASLVREVADRDLRMLTVHVHLGGAKTLDEMARRVFKGLAESSQNRPWYAKLAGALGKHLRSVGLFGTRVEFHASREELTNLWQNLGTELRGLLGLLQGDREGVLLILDDINGLADTREFADWLKSFVDGAATSGEPLPLHLVLVSLPERRQQLVDHNPSLNRVFSIVEVQPLSDEDTRQYLLGALRSVDVQVDEEALRLILRFSGGYPAILQEIGDAAFERTEGDRVGVVEAAEGVVDAAQAIGRKYIKPEVLDAIQSSKYRSILGRVASLTVGESFSRQEVLSQLDDAEQKVFDNFVRRMRELDVLVQNDRGSYRFKNELNRLYYMLAARAQELPTRQERERG